MKNYSKEDILKLVKLAHKDITRKKGKDHSPNVNELQSWIDEYISKESEEKTEVEEKWSQKYKQSIDCNNTKGFSQKAHCQGRKKRETTESMGADSSGSIDAGAFGGKIVKRKITSIPNFDSSLKEALDASAQGQFDVPFLGTTTKGRKNPLEIKGPDSVKNSRAVKDKNFPKWGGPGGIFIKIKDKCKKFPYCNQGDINAIEILKESIDEISKKTGIPKNEIEILVLNEIKQIFI